MKDFRENITADKNILGGKPVITGTRVPVALIVEEIAGEATIEQVMEQYGLTRDQVLAALRYAAVTLREETAFA